MNDRKTMTVDIEFTNLRAHSRGGTMKGWCSVRIGWITIHDCRIMQPEGKTPWLAMPDRRYTAQDGTEKYAPYAFLDRELKELIEAKLQGVTFPDTTAPPAGSAQATAAVPRERSPLGRPARNPNDIPF